MRAINFNWSAAKMANGTVYDFTNGGHAYTITRDGCRFTITKDGETAAVVEYERATRRPERVRVADIIRLSRAAVGEITSGEVYKMRAGEYILPEYEDNTIFEGFHGYHTHRGSSLNMPRESCPYYIGLEIETACRSREAHAALTGAKTNYYYVESDSSLPTYGAEFITMPLRPQDALKPDFWRENFTDIFGDLARAEVPECGQHIHISRTAAGATEEEQNETIQKIALLHEFLLGEDFLTAIYGRTTGHYRSETRKDERTARYISACAEYGAPIAGEAWPRVLAGLMPDPDEHGSRINLQHRNTIEFRQPAGSLKPRTMAARVQFVVSLVTYCRETRPNKISKAGYIRSIPNTRNYEELRRIIADAQALTD